jgi:hypothetical protein
VTTRLVIRQAAVYCDGRLVARLLWSGRCLKVENTRGRGLGRLLPAGYTEGRPDDGSGIYDLWTAKHPHVHVPSDEIVAPSVTRDRGIALALEGVLASARLRLLPVRGPGRRLVGVARDRRIVRAGRYLGFGRAPCQEQEKVMAAGDVSTLPRWAQKLIEQKDAEASRARLDLADYIARETATLDTSTVVADPYSACPRPLGKDTHIHFVGGNVSFSVQFDSADGILHVTAVGHRAQFDGIAVYPATGNAIRVKGGRP